MRVIRRVEYANEKYIRGHQPKDIEPIFLASSELLGMGQTNAGKEIRLIYNQMREEFEKNNREGCFTPDLIDSFQKNVRLLKVNKLKLLKVW